MRLGISRWIAVLLINVPLHGQAPNGTYAMELTPVPGKEQNWPRRTMRIVASADTIPFSHLRDLTGVDRLLRGFPPNACFAVAAADSVFRWAWKARWTPGRADTVRVRVVQSPDAFTDLMLVLNADTVRGIEMTSGGVPQGQDGLVANVRGHRIGDADAQWCAEVQDAYIRTHSSKDVVSYLRGALTVPP